MASKFYFLAQGPRLGALAGGVAAQHVDIATWLQGRSAVCARQLAHELGLAVCDAAPCSQSARESPVEVFVRADPEPQPVIPAAKCDGTNVSGHADGPGPRIEAQSLQAQTRMRGILAEESICASRSRLSFRRQRAIQLPKLRSSARDHAPA